MPCEPRAPIPTTHALLRKIARRQIVIRAPQIVIRAPQIVIHHRYITIRAPQIVIRASQIVIRASQIVIRAPQIVIRASHILIRAQKQLCRATESTASTEPDKLHSVLAVPCMANTLIAPPKQRSRCVAQRPRPASGQCTC